jgi:hypothetical protein
MFASVPPAPPDVAGADVPPEPVDIDAPPEPAIEPAAPTFDPPAPLLDIDPACPDVVVAFIALAAPPDPAVSPSLGCLSLPEHAMSASADAMLTVHVPMAVRSCPAMDAQWQEWVREQDSGLGAAQRDWSDGSGR